MDRRYGLYQFPLIDKQNQQRATHADSVIGCIDDNIESFLDNRPLLKPSLLRPLEIPPHLRMLQQCFIKAILELGSAALTIKQS